jgi:hypothetical protein
MPLVRAPSKIWKQCRPALCRSSPEPRLVPALKMLRCKQLMLEFANREMAELELLKPLSEQFSIAAGVIDVKNF